MHSLWDTGMIERFSNSEDEWFKELTVLVRGRRRQRLQRRGVPPSWLGRVWS
jgi:hypothetical protein